MTHLAPHFLSLALLALVDQTLVDMRDNSTTGDGGLDERVELFVTADGQLEVARRDALYLKVLGCVTRKLENLCGEVLEDGRGVHSCGSTDALGGACALLQVPVNTPDRELEASTNRPRDGLALLGATLSSLSALATLTSFASSRLWRVALGSECKRTLREVVSKITSRFSSLTSHPLVKRIATSERER